MPLELDQIYQSLDDLAVALGPQGANKEGALTRLIDIDRAQLRGSGRAVQRDHRSNLGQLTGTLENNKDDAVRHRPRDRAVRRGARRQRPDGPRLQRLAWPPRPACSRTSVDDLAAALHNLGVAMKEVSTFVRTTRTALSKNIKGLSTSSRRSWSSSAARSTRRSRSRLRRSTTSTTPTTTTPARSTPARTSARTSTRRDQARRGALHVPQPGRRPRRALQRCSTGALGRSAALANKHRSDRDPVDGRAHRPDARRTPGGDAMMRWQKACRSGGGRSASRSPAATCR